MKLLIEEPGSDAMMDFWLNEDDGDKVFAAITQVEAWSAVCRWRTEGRMSANEASAMLASVVAELHRLTEQPLTRPVLQAARAVVERRNLRALDSLQLGSAIVARDLHRSPEMRFIASDQALLAAAHAEGFVIWNPISSE